MIHVGAYIPPFEYRHPEMEFEKCEKYMKEEDMRNVILKDEMGREFSFNSEKKAKKFIQKNGSVREEFTMYKKVGTYSVPAPKLKKL